MDSRVKSLLKNTWILTLSNFASKILVFLMVPIYTSVLSTSEVGIFDIIVSSITLMVPILTLNIVDGVMRFSMDNSTSKEDIVAIGCKFVVISSFIALLIIIVCSFLLGVDSIRGLEVYIGLYFFSYVLNNFLIQFCKGMEKVSDLGIAGVLATFFTVCSNILFLIFFKWGIQGLFLANIIGLAIPNLYLIVRVKLWHFIKNYSISKSLQKEMLVYCIPLIATTVGWWVNSASSRFVVAFMCGVGANGLLSVSYKIPQVINMIHGIFTQAWQITAIKAFGSEDSSCFYEKAFLCLNLILVITCSCLIILSKPLGHFLFQKDFFEAWQFVPFLLISCVFNSASGFWGAVLSAKKNSTAMAISAFYGSVVNLVMNFVLVWLIGIQGAAIAAAISSFIIYCVRKKAIGNYSISNCFGWVYCSWALLCFQAYIEIYTILWWLELIVMIVILYIYKDILKILFDFIIVKVKE